MDFKTILKQPLKANKTYFACNKILV